LIFKASTLGNDTVGEFNALVRLAIHYPDFEGISATLSYIKLDISIGL